MAEVNLDPADWAEDRKLAHRMVDDMWDYLQSLREGPVWRPMPDEAKASFARPLPDAPGEPADNYAEFLAHVLPYNKGNVHPHFWSWVQGTGTPMAMMYEMLAAGMNPNATIGEHSAMYVEEQAISWCCELMGFPTGASGLLTSGASMANVTALIVARDFATGGRAKSQGLSRGAPLTVYCSTETHSCVRKAVQACGIGSDYLRAIPCRADYSIDVAALRQAVRADREAGLHPACIVGNAGTVNTGAFDPLTELRQVATEERLWFHVDGAFGALATLVPGAVDERVVTGMRTADSLAFDLHKWVNLPYEAGCLLVRDAAAHRASFAYQPSYLASHERGLAAGPDPVSNYGLELSRGFKALKVWMHLKEHGRQRIADVIERNIADAQYFAELVDSAPELELTAPRPLNVVCYRYRFATEDAAEHDRLNKELLMRMHERGLAAPSYTLLGERYTIRMCNVNQRSVRADFDHLLAVSIELGRELSAEHELTINALAATDVSEA